MILQSIFNGLENQLNQRTDGIFYPSVINAVSFVIRFSIISLAIDLGWRPK